MARRLSIARGRATDADGSDLTPQPLDLVQVLEHVVADAERGHVELHESVPQSYDAVEDTRGRGRCEWMLATSVSPCSLGHVGEEAHHFPGPCGVERGHGLVRQDDGGALDEDTRYRDPLLLASGEPGGALVREVRDADPFERVERQTLITGPDQ